MFVLADDPDELPLQVRHGLHTGTVDMVGGGVGGVVLACEKNECIG